MPYEFLSGTLMMSCLVAGLFFLKFWRKTYDKLFLYFACSFFLMSFERILLGYLGVAQEPSPLIYCIRLGAFSLIIYAIYCKNRDSQT